MTDPALMGEVHAGLTGLKIGMAYDDFGAGQSRLNELAQCPPDYLKFDMSLVRNIDAASPQRQCLSGHLGADGPRPGHPFRRRGRGNTGRSRRLPGDGLRLGQGYFFGRPAPPGKPR